MKDDFFTEQVNALFDELQQESLLDLKKADPEYNDLRAAHAEASKEYEAILGDLPRKDMKFMEKYVNDIYELIDREQTWVYLQGYKDCVKFLRFIGIIEGVTV